MGSRIRSGALVVCLLASACSTTSRDSFGDRQFALVHIENDTGRTLTVFGCPLCKSRGGGIPGLRGGGGGGIGWTVAKPDPLRYTVELSGRRFTCQPPKAVDMTADLPAAGPLYDVDYRVTADGTCEAVRW